MHEKCRLHKKAFLFWGHYATYEIIAYIYLHIKK